MRPQASHSSPHTDGKRAARRASRLRITLAEIANETKGSTAGIRRDEEQTVSNGRYYLKTGAGLFVGLVTVVVITLRISGSIHWSWILILAPIWIIACVLILIIILASITIAKNAEISPDPNRVPAIPVDE